MKTKRRSKFVNKIKNMVLVTCDWSEDGGSRFLRNGDKYLTTHTVSEHHDTELCHREHHKASSREQNVIFECKNSYIILYNDQQMHTIISQITTLLHVSTLSYHPQGACNQYLTKLHKYFKCSCW